MEVLVNNETIDVTLEEETTVGEVVQGLQEWLREASMTVTEITVDDSEMPLDLTGGVGERDINTVDRIRIEALSPRELAASTLVTLRDYVAYVRDSIREEDMRSFTELAHEYSSVKPSLRRFVPELFSGDSSDGKPAVVDLLETPSEAAPGGESGEQLAAVLDQAHGLLDARLREVVDPARELRSTARAISAMLPQISEVSVMLQTGQDREAMRRVTTFSELVGRFLRLLSSDQRDECAADIEQLNETLRELAEAFQSQDSVLIGDLLEYEVVPRVQALLTAVTEEYQE